MEMIDSLMEGVGNVWTHLGRPMFEGSDVGRSFLTQAQRVNAGKVGIVFVGAVGVAAGVTLVKKALNASYSFRKEIEAVALPSLQPEMKKIKETIMNPIHLMGRIKMVLSRSLLPMVTGMFSIAGSAFVFTRFDKLIKLVK